MTDKATGLCYLDVDCTLTAVTVVTTGRAGHVEYRRLIEVTPLDYYRELHSWKCEVLRI